jgi:hypothetical protein
MIRNRLTAHFYSSGLGHRQCFNYSFAISMLRSRFEKDRFKDISGGQSDYAEESSVLRYLYVEKVIFEQVFRQLGVLGDRYHSEQLKTV